MVRTDTHFYTSAEAFPLDDGSSLPGLTLAYEMYGSVNPASRPRNRSAASARRTSRW